ncbi:nitronate monooxygenase, partial [Xanthomonas oryzae]
MTGFSNVDAFQQRFGLRLPILLSPMAGACPVPLSAAVADAGGMGAMGAVLSQPQDIVAWMAAFREAGAGPAQVNLWIPDPAPVRDAAAEARLRAFLSQWGPMVPETACDAMPVDFDAQFDALLAARPAVALSIMGVF